eukprot:7326344-Pyramimonas_sp.AAC.1
MAGSMDRLKIRDVVESRDIGGVSRRTQRNDVVDLPQISRCDRQAADGAPKIVARRHASPFCGCLMSLGEAWVSAPPGGCEAPRTQRRSLYTSPRRAQRCQARLP